MFAGSRRYHYPSATSGSSPLAISSLMKPKVPLQMRFNRNFYHWTASNHESFQYGGKLHHQKQIPQMTSSPHFHNSSHYCLNCLQYQQKRQYALSSKRDRAAKRLRERFEAFKQSEVASEKSAFAAREEELRLQRDAESHVIHKDQKKTRRKDKTRKTRQRDTTPEETVHLTEDATASPSNTETIPRAAPEGEASAQQQPHDDDPLSYFENPNKPSTEDAPSSFRQTISPSEDSLGLNRLLKQRIKEQQVPAKREEARKLKREALKSTQLRKSELYHQKEDRPVFAQKTVPVLKSDPGLWKRNEKYRPTFISPAKAKFSEIFEDMNNVVHQPENSRILKVSIIGNPNAGKSTFLNAVLGEKVSAVSHKVCSTRNNVLGVMTEGERQVLFFDTPGILSPDNKRLYRKNEDIMGEAFASLYDADMAVLFIDATKDLSHINHLLSTVESFYLKYRFKSPDKPILPRGIVAVVNKVDLITPKNRVGDIVNELQKSALFSRVFPLSAKQGEGLDIFKNFLLSKAKPGKWMFSKDKKTDMTREDRVIEVVREKLFTHVHSELPYDCRVELPHPISYFEHKKTKELSAAVGVLITCPSPAAVRIVVGQLKPLHLKSLRELESIIKRKVYLTFNVKLGRHVR